MPGQGLGLGSGSGLGLGLVGYQVIKNQIIEEIGKGMEEYVLCIHL